MITRGKIGQEVTVSAVVTKQDGTVIDHGVIARTKPKGFLRRAVARVVGRQKES